VPLKNTKPTHYLQTKQIGNIHPTETLPKAVWVNRGIFRSPIFHFFSLPQNFTNLTTTFKPQIRPRDYRSPLDKIHQNCGCSPR